MHADGMEDWELLQEYTQRQSETAFRALVARHLSLVHSAALRQVNNRALAEEISQTVFMLLARKASRLPSRTILAGWLFATTRFVASRALRSELRRQRREQESLFMQQINGPDPVPAALAGTVASAASAGATQLATSLSPLLGEILSELRLAKIKWVGGVTVAIVLLCSFSAWLISRHDAAERSLPAQPLATA